MITIWTKTQKILFLIIAVIIIYIVFAIHNLYYLPIINILISYSVYLEYKNINNKVSKQNKHYNEFLKLSAKSFISSLIFVNLLVLTLVVNELKEFLYNKYNIENFFLILIIFYLSIALFSTYLYNKRKNFLNNINK
ncbi:hypothetical protein [Gemelliphila palaticanis]|uniref:Uncharacterized protein n=1 Tax=Gemelliphila palaticanis TaxID=81950 RepID=A0ABX2SZV1_9BACL|nr:hypothetical protein [Gemella palaticanis]MBF0715702.1 hypothetical protein [Gemella palaticanis]NYS47632.1 hypothetical protein [Gemella palaticanis]